MLHITYDPKLINASLAVIIARYVGRLFQRVGTVYRESTEFSKVHITRLGVTSFTSCNDLCTAKFVVMMDYTYNAIWY